MNILVIGGSGYLGSQIVSYINDTFSSKETTLFVMQRETSGQINGVKYFVGNFNDANFLKKVFFKKFDVIILSFGISSPHEIQKDTINAHHVNVLLVQQIADFISSTQEKETKVIFLSSRQEYGRVKEIPVSENHALNPISNYGLQKKLASDYLLGLSKQGKFNLIILRISNVYGYYSNNSKSGGYHVIHTLTKNALSTQGISIFGKGHQIRDYLYITDFLKVIKFFISNDNKSVIYNIGSGIPLTFLAACNEIAKETSSSIRFIDWDETYLSYESGDYCADIQLLKKDLSFFNPIKFEIGVKKLIKSFK